MHLCQRHHKVSRSCTCRERKATLLCHRCLAYIIYFIQHVTTLEVAKLVIVIFHHGFVEDILASAIIYNEIAGTFTNHTPSSKYVVALNVFFLLHGVHLALYD